MSGSLGDRSPGTPVETLGGFMRSGLMRRSLAAASATVMAGAAMVVGGAGVASAAPVSADYRVGSAFLANPFDLTREVSEAAPTFGDTVTITTTVQRDGSTSLLYRMRDHTPACLEYVAGSARWQATGGDIASEATAPGEFSQTAEYVQFSKSAGVTPAPFWMTAQYTVSCDAGQLNTGGTWIKRAPAGDDELGSRTMGPTITVNRASISNLFLTVPSSPEVGTPTTLKAQTTAPEGSTVNFAVSGQTLSGTVTNGEATAQWTPATAGEQTVVATLNQTATHLGKTYERSVTVAEQTVNSSVALTVPASAQVGVPTELTATVDPAGAGGTVTFKEQGTVIDAVSVPASGIVTTGWIPTTEGERSIDAEFSGRSGVNPSNAVGKIVDVDPKSVEMETSTTTVEAVEMTQLGTAVSLQATVSTEQAGGTVRFYDGGALIGEADVDENGVATLEWTPTTAGQRSVRAVFSGTETVLASQGTTQVVISSATDEPEVPDTEDVPSGGSGSLGSLTGSLGN